jgi:NADPH:quinone reductase
MAASIPKSMRALRMLRNNAVSPPSMTMEDVPTPQALAGHVLVKVAASPIHPSDLLNASGSFGLTLYPRTPGRDFSGTIIDGPSNRIGQEVFGTSGFTYAFSEDGFQAEYAVVTDDAVVEKPKGLSFVQAATVGVPFTTADLMLETARAQKGETVLVLGANGAVGKAAAVLAAHRGCRILRAVRGAGGDIDTASDPAMNAISTLTAGKGVDVVLDTVGTLSLTAAAIAKLGAFGRYVTITSPRSGTRTLEIDLLDLYRTNKHIIGCNSLGISVRDQADRLRRISAVFESDIYKSMQESDWEEIPLQDAVAAYKNASGSKKKYVIVMK